jgi:hypothetical protein
MVAPSGDDRGPSDDSSAGPASSSGGTQPLIPRRTCNARKRGRGRVTGAERPASDASLATSRCVATCRLRLAFVFARAAHGGTVS